MIFVKMAYRSAKGKIQDYLICLFTMTALAGLLFSAFMLPVFTELSQSKSGVYMTNSLPGLLAVTLLFLMLYMNKFMLKRRSQELAIYSLSGISKDKICLLYIGEQLLMGLFALAIGLIAGVLILGIILTMISATWHLQDVFFAILKTCMLYAVVHVLSLLISVLYLRRQNIKRLLDLRKDNERQITNKAYLIVLSVVAILALAVCFYQITHFSPVTASTLVITIGAFLYASYTSLLGWLSWYRAKCGSLLFRNSRLFIIGQLLSKIRSMIRMSTVISGCLLVATCSFVAGWIFTNNKTPIIGAGNDLTMGFAQLYIAVLFTIIVFAIISLQQIVDVQEHRQKLTVLKHLGADYDKLNGIVFKQVFLNLTTPILMAVILMLFSIYPLGEVIGHVSSKELLLQGVFIYTGIFGLVYACYMCVTYIILKRQNT